MNKIKDIWLHVCVLFTFLGICLVAVVSTLTSELNTLVVLFLVCVGFYVLLNIAINKLK
jgi:hypothetical protein